MSGGLEIELDDGTEPTYSVGELCGAINDVLRRGFPEGVWVRGEIQSWNGAGKHAYFSLVEAVDGRKSTISVSCFEFTRTRLRPLLARHGLSLADGVKVRIRGTLDLYAPSGRLGLKMSDIDPRFTIGELALEREAVVRRLKESGLYDRNRTTVLAPVPLRIGLVTSFGSAAYHDFIQHLTESQLGFQIMVADARVQGDTAVVEIVERIEQFGRRTDLDVVVLIRGGGSRTDLAAFDHEDIATAIAHCPLPVFTGIGHEIDTAVADEVAHRSHKTPTACAGALVDLVLDYIGATEDVWLAIEQIAEGALTSLLHHVDSVANNIRHRVLAGVDRGAARLDQRAERLRAEALRVVERAEQRVGQSVLELRRTPQVLAAREQQVDAVAERVRLLDPAVTMARGWSITRTIDGRTVRSIADVQVGHELITTFANGTARSRVEETTP